MSVKKICFIGAGGQGCQNSLRAVAAGFETRVFDVSQAVLDAMKGRQQPLVERYVEAFGFDATALNEGIDNIHRTTDIEEALSGVELVLESLPEKMQLKQDFYKDLETKVARDMLLATNTSSLPITPISEVLNYPEWTCPG